MLKLIRKSLTSRLHAPGHKMTLFGRLFVILGPRTIIFLASPRRWLSRLNSLLKQQVVVWLDRESNRMAQKMVGGNVRSGAHPPVEMHPIPPDQHDLLQDNPMVNPTRETVEDQQMLARINLTNCQTGRSNSREPNIVENSRENESGLERINRIRSELIAAQREELALDAETQAGLRQMEEDIAEVQMQAGVRILSRAMENVGVSAEQAAVAMQRFSLLTPDRDESEFVPMDPNELSNIRPVEGVSHVHLSSVISSHQPSRILNVTQPQQEPGNPPTQGNVNVPRRKIKLPTGEQKPDLMQSQQALFQIALKDAFQKGFHAGITIRERQIDKALFAEATSEPTALDSFTRHHTLTYSVKAERFDCLDERVREFKFTCHRITYLIQNKDGDPNTVHEDRKQEYHFMFRYNWHHLDDTNKVLLDIAPQMVGSLRRVVDIMLAVDVVSRLLTNDNAVPKLNGAYSRVRQSLLDGIYKSADLRPPIV